MTTATPGASAVPSAEPLPAEPKPTGRGGATLKRKEDDQAALAAFAHIERLTSYAAARLYVEVRAEAEDIAAEAIAQFIDPNYVRWDPVKEPDLYRHLRSRVNGIVVNRNRWVFNHPHLVPSKLHDDRMAWTFGDMTTPARTAYLREMLDHFDVELEARFGERAMMMLTIAIETPVEAAETLGITTKHAIRLRRTLTDFLREVRQDYRIDPDALLVYGVPGPIVRLKKMVSDAVGFLNAIFGRAPRVPAVVKGKRPDPTEDAARELEKILASIKQPAGRDVEDRPE